jgi:hypothetical protein
MKKSFFVIVALVVVAAFVIAAAPATVAQTSTQTGSAVIIAAAPFTGTVVTPFLDLWKGSAHADAAAAAFNHWNDAKGAPTAKVLAACARCHTPAGFAEYITTGKVAADVTTTPGHVLTCEACHSPAAVALSKVTFPSGVTVTDLGPEARCMTCHQGLESSVSVTNQISNTFGLQPKDYDTVVAPLVTKGVTTTFGFRNVHYLAAGATLYGNIAKGGYQYAGKEYDSKFDHVLGINTCLGCHDQHSLEIKVEVCAECHNNGKPMKVADLQNIREPSMAADYDGDANVTEGIAGEVKGMQDILYKSIQAYAIDVTKTPIAYDPAAYPYFFVAGADGKPAKNDKGATTSFNKWTARLLQAAYNLQFSIKDPGSFAHNPKYTLELLYDSIADLNTKLAKPIDMSKMHRNGSGHFNGSGPQFRDWDAEGEVPAGCARCHSAEGLPTYIKNAGTLVIDSRGNVQVTGIIGMPTANGFQCATCHDESKFPAITALTGVVFPSGKTVTFSTKDAKGVLQPVTANICLECHQGRQSTLSVNTYLKNFKDADVVTSTISFKNVHYFAAGATLFGTDAQVAYEYDGQAYNGRNLHDGKTNKCTDCHDKHELNVKLDTCTTCHPGVKDPGEIRMASDKTDWNGNKDVKEPIEKEIATFQEKLYAAIQKYATDKSKTPIVYDGSTNPYFFVAGADGKATVDKTGAPVRYNAFSPRLLKAAYNYQFSIKDPGAFAHNPKYTMQILYDSIKDLGGDVTGLTRPEAPKK